MTHKKRGDSPIFRLQPPQVDVLELDLHRRTDVNLQGQPPVNESLGIAIFSSHMVTPLIASVTLPLKRE